MSGSHFGFTHPVIGKSKFYEILENRGSRKPLDFLLFYSCFGIIVSHLALINNTMDGYGHLDDNEVLPEEKMF